MDTAQPGRAQSLAAIAEAAGARRELPSRLSRVRVPSRGAQDAVPKSPPNGTCHQSNYGPTVD